MRFALVLSLAALSATVPCAAGTLPHFRAQVLFDLTPSNKTTYELDIVPDAAGQVTGTKSSGKDSYGEA